MHVTKLLSASGGSDDKAPLSTKEVEKAKQGMFCFVVIYPLCVCIYYFFVFRIELERLRLWHKEVALRKKRMLELERKRAEAEALEKEAIEKKKAEEEKMRVMQRQQLLEFRRLKHAEVYLALIRSIFILIRL